MIDCPQCSTIHKKVDTICPKCGICWNVDFNTHCDICVPDVT